MNEMTKEEVEKKLKKEKLKKKIVDHLREDMSEAKTGIHRDEELTKSVKNMK